MSDNIADIDQAFKRKCWQFRVKSPAAGRLAVGDDVIIKPTKKLEKAAGLNAPVVRGTFKRRRKGTPTQWASGLHTGSTFELDNVQLLTLGQISPQERNGWSQTGFFYII